MHTRVCEGGPSQAALRKEKVIMSKEEFLTALRDEGYNADYSSIGIPTVYVDAAENISATSRQLRKFAGKLGYFQSYGIMPAPKVKASEAV